MSQKKFRITQADFMLANRKAARDEEIREHGRQITFRSVKQKSKKAYDRNRLKRTGIGNDDLSFLLTELLHGFFLANRKAAREEEIRELGRPKGSLPTYIS